MIHEKISDRFFLFLPDTPAVKELKAIINSALSEQVQQVFESAGTGPGGYSLIRA